MARFNRALCTRCRIEFVKEKPDQQFCCFLCEAQHTGMKLPGVKLKNMRCVHCWRSFNAYQKKKFCSELCKTEERSTKKTEQQKNETANKLTIEKGTITERLSKILRKSTRNVPVDEMILGSEYACAFDDKAQDHYIRGRKWDKI